MTRTITAAVLESCTGHARAKDSQPLKLKMLTLDPPRPGELLVRIDAAGLCHTDLSAVNGDRVRVRRLSSSGMRQRALSRRWAIPTMMALPSAIG